ncbi:hypothetical protein BDY21DRAFT_352942 [Lineolata rhizophorae]|uniref:Uncharacterized protein n=1 Tax=Lineolata rhizophorae TaxID=578093 RepID=A0A6A6NRP0_9PEZI|nr:hypothetical protein BDY21DRAFT_352942 [Lineolata rhizophorae]
MPSAGRGRKGEERRRGTARNKKAGGKNTGQAHGKAKLFRPFHIIFFPLRLGGPRLVLLLRTPFPDHILSQPACGRDTGATRSTRRSPPGDGSAHTIAPLGACTPTHAAAQVPDAKVQSARPTPRALLRPCELRIRQGATFFFPEFLLLVLLTRGARLPIPADICTSACTGTPPSPCTLTLPALSRPRPLSPFALAARFLGAQLHPSLQPQSRRGNAPRAHRVHRPVHPARSPRPSKSLPRLSQPTITRTSTFAYTTPAHLHKHRLFPRPLSASGGSRRAHVCSRRIAEPSAEPPLRSSLFQLLIIWPRTRRPDTQTAPRARRRRTHERTKDAKPGRLRPCRRSDGRGSNLPSRDAETGRQTSRGGRTDEARAAGRTTSAKRRTGRA